MDKNLFRYFANKNNDDTKSIAQALNVAKITVLNKLNGKRGDFTRAEIAILKQRWQLTDEQCSNIFFN